MEKRSGATSSNIELSLSLYTVMLNELVIRNVPMRYGVVNITRGNPGVESIHLDPGLDSGTPTLAARRLQREGQTN